MGMHVTVRIYYGVKFDVKKYVDKDEPDLCITDEAIKQLLEDALEDAGVSQASNHKIEIVTKTGDEHLEEGLIGFMIEEILHTKSTYDVTHFHHLDASKLMKMFDEYSDYDATLDKVIKCIDKTIEFRPDIVMVTYVE